MKGEVQTGNQQDPENSKLLSYVLSNTVPFTLKSPVVITDAKPRYKTSYQLIAQGRNARANKTFHFRITSEYTSSSVQDIKLRGDPRNKHITISGPAISASFSQLIAS